MPLLPPCHAQPMICCIFTEDGPGKMLVDGIYWMFLSVWLPCLLRIGGVSKVRRIVCLGGLVGIRFMCLPYGWVKICFACLPRMLSNSSGAIAEGGGMLHGASALPEPAQTNPCPSALGRQVARWEFCPHPESGSCWRWRVLASPAHRKWCMNLCHHDSGPRTL